MEATPKDLEKLQDVKKHETGASVKTKDTKIDWATRDKIIADINELKNRFSEVRQFSVSEDGEQIAAIVLTPNNEFTVSVNGHEWDQVFERAWSLKFNKEGKAACLVYKDNAWTVAVDGILWNEKFDYVWNLQIAPNGKNIGVNIKRGDQYGVCLDDMPWAQGFADVRNLFISPDGTKTAASVAIKALAEADIFGFQKGVWTVAVDGIPWKKNFVNVWGLAFSPDGKHVAAETRINLYDYAIIVDDDLWPETFKCVWEPIFSPKDNSVIAPVKLPFGWTLAMNGKPIWKTFVQVWNPRFSPGADKIAAVVAPEFGEWTIAVDGVAWRKTFNDTVLTPVFSPDGKRVAAIAKKSRDPMSMGSSLHSIEGNDRWTIIVDGIPWETDFDMVWDPVFSPDSNDVVAKAEHKGKYFIVLNGKVGRQAFDELWSPVFSPDGNKLLIRCIKDGKYHRYVLPLSEI